MSDQPRPITPDEREENGLPRVEGTTPQPDTSNMPRAEITTEDGERIPITDLLVNMYLRQMAHREEYEKIYRSKGLDPVPQGLWGNLSNPRVQMEIRETAGYVVEELYEAIGNLKNKKWKQSFRDTDPDEFYEEIADAWHFWLELMIVAGMTPDKIQKYYFGKAETNDDRRASGY